MTMPAASVDWFVAAESGFSGDGSRERPFHDPWLALRCAGPGDVIHIAAGTYFGRYDRSSWVVDCPGLTIRGGYSQDFSRRTPWQTPSVFAVFPECEAVRESNLLSGRGDHSGLVLDGLFFDASGANAYGGKPFEGIAALPQMAGAMVSLNAGEVTIRNCVFANSGSGGVELSGDGSRFENNFLVNIIGIGMLEIRSASGGNNKAITVAGNSFCFAHDYGDPPLGTGGDRAMGIRIHRSAVVRDNVFVACGNAAIALYQDVDRVSVDGNLFYLTPRDIVNSRAQGNTADITEKNIDELEDVGLKSAAGNTAQEAGMSGFRTEWLDAYSRHLLGNYAKPPREAANGLRVAAGLPPLAAPNLEKPEDKGALAPRLAPSDALALRFTAKQGFHPMDLEANFTNPSAQPTPAWRRIEWSSMENADPALANERVELRAGLGFEQNSTLLPDAGPSTHMGIRIYQPSSDEGSIFVLARRYTLPSRQFEEAMKYSNGREVESFYLLRGVYRADVDSSSRQKVTLIVESIVPAPLAAPAPAPPSAGRAWFVKAGSSGGDGTREKPFRDPFQPLDKAEGGDTIHVAAGDYFGKLHSGKWKILARNLTLLGGYNAEFTERNPWNNPTRFVLDAEEKAKGTPEGTLLASEENSDGLVLDGFIFDGAAYNTYTPCGSLDLQQSPLSPLVSLRGGQAPITVRNCLFINGSGSAIDISCPFGVFENNIVLNTSGWAVGIRADGPGPWIVRNNSILFACDPTPRAGTGKSSSDGVLLRLSGRAAAALERNIFAFADNFGVRCTLPQQNVSFDGNVLAANCFNHLTDAQYLWTDSSSWQRRAVADSAFASCRENTLELPRLPVDSGYADAALARLFALPSRISQDQWKTFAAQAGSSATPPAPATEASRPAPVIAKPASGPGASINDLLASLAGAAKQMKQEEPRAPGPAEPVYCPVYDWKKALLLAQETPFTEPGVHQMKLAVSFAAAEARPEVQYTPVTPQEIDANHASFDNQPVELEVTECRLSSTNPSLFPAGLTKDSYDAYSAATAGDRTRVRIAVIVRLDTNAGKVLGRATSSDTLQIRGTARVPLNPEALSIVVDTAQIVES